MNDEQKTTQPRFTPGPWTIENTSPRTFSGVGDSKYIAISGIEKRMNGDAWHVAMLSVGEEEEPPDGLDETVRLFTLANAHLIAAAPDLYDYVATLENDDGSIPDWLWEKRNAILAKARGESA